MGQAFYFKDKEKNKIINIFFPFRNEYKNKYKLYHNVDNNKTTKEMKKWENILKSKFPEIYNKYKKNNGIIYLLANLENEDSKGIVIKYKETEDAKRNKFFLITDNGENIQELKNIKKYRYENSIIVENKYRKPMEKLGESEIWGIYNKENEKFTFSEKLDAILQYLEQNPTKLEYIGEYSESYKQTKNKEDFFVKNKKNSNQNKILINFDNNEYIDIKKLLCRKDCEKKLDINNYIFIPISLLFLDKNNVKHGKEINFLVEVLYTDYIKDNNEYKNIPEKEIKNVIKQYLKEIIGKWQNNTIGLILRNKLKNYPNYTDITQNIDFYNFLNKHLILKNNLENKEILNNF